jgi:hypothetical protein
MHARTPLDQKPSDVVTVRGCLDGSVLTTVDDTGVGAMSHRFDLTGDKRVRRLLKDHSGHLVEITGVLKSRNADSPPMVKEKPIGKGRVYVGGGTSSAAAADGGRPSITVRELTHLASRCSASP